MAMSKEEVEAMLQVCVAEIEKRCAERLQVIERRMAEMEMAHSHTVQHLARRITQLGG